MYVDFEYMQPESLQQCCFLLSRAAGAAIIYNGGTDLLVQLRAKKLSPRLVLDIKQLPECHGISIANDVLSIGAATTFTQLAEDVAVARYAPALARAAARVGSVLVRNKATLAGNIQNASPAADGLVAAWGLDARLRLVSAQGERSVALDDFVLAPGKTCLAPDEIIRSIDIPLQAWDYSNFFKVGRRNALAISVVNGAIAVRFKEGTTEIAEARIILGAVAPTPVRILAAEQLLRGQRYDKNMERACSEVIKQSIAPISDIRASAQYRRYIAAVMMCREIEQAYQEVAL